MALATVIAASTSRCLLAAPTFVSLISTSLPLGRVRSEPRKAATRSVHHAGARRKAAMAGGRHAAGARSGCAGDGRPARDERRRGDEIRDVFLAFALIALIGGLVTARFAV